MGNIEAKAQACFQQALEGPCKRELIAIILEQRARIEELRKRLEQLEGGLGGGAWLELLGFQRFRRN